MELIGYILLTIFSFIGLLQTAKYLCVTLTKPKTKYNHMLLYPVKDGIKDIEMVIRFLHNQTKWDCYDGDTVLVLDLGLDEESRRIAKVLSLELDTIIYCTPEDVLEKIDEQIKY